MLDDRARVLLDVARAVSSEVDVEAVLRHVLDAARDVTEAQYAALGVLDEARSHLVRFITVGVDEQTRQDIGALPTGHGVLGELIRDPRPLRLSDVGSHPRSYGFPGGHPAMRAFLGAPILVGGEPYGNLYLSEKRGGEQFTDEDEEALVVLAASAGLAIEHAERYARSESQRLRLERSVAALDASLRISRALGTETDLGAVLELVAKRGRALVDAQALVIEALDGDELVVAAAAGELPVNLVGQRVVVTDTVASLALGTGRMQRLEDEQNRARFEQYGLGRFGLTAESGLVVPLIFRERGYGVMVIVDRPGARLSDEDERVLEAFASSAATAVATAHSATLERRRQRLVAAEQERARWARELHDETLQGLASLRLMLGALRRADEQTQPGGTPHIQAPLKQTTEQIDREIATLRALITELRPLALEGGITAAIHDLAHRSAHHGLEVTLTLDLPDEAVRDELETAVYRIIQEALTNARKHGNATHATVTATHDDAGIHITITDDGTGFDTTTKTAGFGLLGMQERTDIHNGTLTITSTPNNGTTINATLPTHTPRPPSTHTEPQQPHPDNRSAPTH